MLVERKALLPVSPEEAFALITQPERLRRWQAVSARVDLRAGGQYRWTIVPGHVALGTFTEIEPGKRVIFGWGWEGSPELAPDASTVTITLEPVAGATLVQLVHSGLTDEQAASHLEGWTHYFERLERAATTGDAGPDEWMAAPAELNQLTSAEATLAVLQQVLRGIDAADLDKQTPCEKFTVGQLADHLLGSLGFLGVIAGIEVSDDVSRELEDRIAFVAQQVTEAWRARGLQGSVQAGPGEMPAAVAASIMSLEFLIHAWDFAIATGQSLTVSDELTSYVLGLAEQVVPGQRAGGSFAEPVAAGPDADVLQRLVAFSGRAA
jgi:uncharacterized protein (TIGR03086 family)